MFLNAKVILSLYMSILAVFVLYYEKFFELWNLIVQSELFEKARLCAAQRLST